MEKLFLSTAIFLLSLSVQTYAASFDCAKATSVTEKLICSDESISKLDEQLASAYKQGLDAEKDKDAFKKMQIEWLKQQRACKDAECLSKTYQARIAELNNSSIADAQAATNSSSIDSASKTNASIDGNKKPLTFTLTKGEGYPICKQYVEMLNATKYPNMGLLACERKNLPNYPLFKSPQWTEMEDKSQMEKIIKERITIGRTRYWKKERIDVEINHFMTYLKENHLKIFSFKDDFDKDGVTDIAYKFEILYLVPDETVDCNYQTLNYVDDGKTTIENAKDMTTRDAVRYEGFNTSENDKLFYYGDTIFNSSLSDPNLYVWMLGYNTICEIAIH